MKTLQRISKQAMKAVFWSAHIFIFLIVMSCEDNASATCEELGNCPETEFDYLELAATNDQVTEVRNIVYGSYHSDNLVDLIEVPENADAARPLILLSPGGGFKYFNRIPDLKNLAKNLAKRGYVVGIVKYGINNNINNADPVALQEIWLKGVIDQKTAIRYFKTNATHYRIDPDEIFIGGWSNGGQLAISTATLQENQLATIENEGIRTSVTSLVETMGGMEGDDYTEVNSSVRGALLMNIYSFDLNSIDANDPAMMFIHHTESRISSMPQIKTIGAFEIGNDQFYGPQPITEKALTEGFNMGADLEFITMSGQDYIPTIIDLNYHEPNFAPLSSFNYNQIAAFFHRNLQ